MLVVARGNGEACVQGEGEEGGGADGEEAHSPILLPLIARTRVDVGVHAAAARVLARPDARGQAHVLLFSAALQRHVLKPALQDDEDVAVVVAVKGGRRRARPRDVEERGVAREGGGAAAAAAAAAWRGDGRRGAATGRGGRADHRLNAAAPADGKDYRLGRERRLVASRAAPRRLACGRGLHGQQRHGRRQAGEQRVRIGDGAAAPRERAPVSWRAAG